MVSGSCWCMSAAGQVPRSLFVYVRRRSGSEVLVGVCLPQVRFRGPCWCISAAGQVPRFLMVKETGLTL